MRLPIALVLLTPAVVYLDVVIFFVPVLSGVALFCLPILLIWAWLGRRTKPSQSKGTLLFSGVMLMAYPMVTLFFAHLVEQRIAEEVREVGAVIAQYRANNEHYPDTLKIVRELEVRYAVESDHALRVAGRVVSYFHSQKATPPTQSQEFAKLSYWSFGAHQRQIFDIGSGSFESPLID
jgi:hypothetical protein